MEASQGLGPLPPISGGGAAVETWLWPSHPSSRLALSLGLEGHKMAILGEVDVSGDMPQQETTHSDSGNASFWGAHPCIPKSSINVC